TVGTPMTPYTVLTVTGGVAPYTCSVAAGSAGQLPPGLSLVATSTGCEVTGTPTSTYSTASVTFTVTDALGNKASATSTVNFTVTLSNCILSVPSQISGTVDSHLADAYFSLVQGAWSIGISGPGQCVQSVPYGPGYTPAGSVTASAFVTITVTLTPGTGGGPPNTYSFSDVATGISATVDLTGCYRFSLFKSVTTFPALSG